MPRVRVIKKVDPAKVIETEEQFQELRKDLIKAAKPIVLPSFKTAIARKLGKTIEPHKKRNDGSVRSPIATGEGRNAKASGSETEKKAKIDVAGDQARDAKGRFTGGFGYGIVLESDAKTHDDPHIPTLALMIGGRKGKGLIKKRVKFWGREEGEGSVIVRGFKHVKIPADRQFIPSVYTPKVLEALIAAFEKVYVRYMEKDNFKGWDQKVKVELD